MDSWLQNIDPRLLEKHEPLVEHVGSGFLQDEMQVDQEHMAFEPIEESQDESAHMGVVLDMSEHVFDAFPNLESPAANNLEAEFYNYLQPVTPQRDFSSAYRSGLYTPPSLLCADANVFQPGSSRHNHNRFALLGSNVLDTASQQVSYRSIGKGGCLTPDSATTIQIELLSPTRRAPARSRPLIVSPTSTLLPSTNGMSATARAVEDIVAWTAEAYNVPAAMSANHLAPQATNQPGRRSQATSVASTLGHGDFACDGTPGKRCGKRFMTKTALSHHARCHKPPRHFCSMCDSGFYYMKDLTRHIKTHGPRDRHLICNNRACKYHILPFARKDHLARHILSSGHSQQG